MRAQKSKTKKHKTQKNKCLVCRQRCIDEMPQIICRIRPEQSGVVTRSVTKLLKSFNEFIIIEVYRCMPLLGDEEKVAPNWDVHIVRFQIVFLTKF